MTVAGIITAIVVGAIVGMLGRLVLPGRQPIGVLLTVGVGIVAALLGTALAQGVGVATTNGVDWIELVFQIGLAAVGVGLVSALRGGRSRTGRY
ncbi:GlsB/YeaQ/YmgE family stress response membrane protein [Actinocorallia sp. A-T 12471]|uniref:GlsB/YeaQ/YmgE family stress response membrane protein n=1 Tax=Actinocorallia sp. A-T 12471 TaxID=3089813 RepID=UPI0029D01988|nr:GlsB/YeaQ/YmgE family stress response membrane protein [Actinocorallia sp. A-T 12471]MDX6744099.1 GlsB/YeaQ/YmgE family stress response membrane protein [Actinocorallia sp. A-T 12471]